MAIVLGTTIKKEDGKDVPEGTPVNKLSKADKELAKELNLLVEVPDESSEDEDEDGNEEEVVDEKKAVPPEDLEKA